MRGIAGLVHFGDRPVEGANVHQMMHAMAIGPVDRLEVRSNGSFAVGHMVQNALFEDQFETQPLVKRESGLVMVTDAMLDNRDELADAFAWTAADASQRPDSAFVFAAYERWGNESPAKLEGNFAFIVWNGRERRLFAAVDPLGFRPFYFFSGGDSLIFATTLRGLFALRRIPRELNESVLAAHVARINIASAETLYRDVYQLKGGHSLSADAAGYRISQYWNPNAERVLRLRSDREYVEAYRTEFERAVRVGMRRRQGTVAALLSGGLDSSAVAAVAGKALAEQGQRLRAIHRIHRGIGRYSATLRELDESPYVEAFRAGAPHIDVHFLPPPDATALIPDWNAYFEDNLVPFRGLPGGDDPTLRELLQQHDVGMVLNGLGGNYLGSLECHSTGYLGHLFVTGAWLRWFQEASGHSRVYGRPMQQIIRYSVLSPILRSVFPQNTAIQENDPVRLLRPELRIRTEIEARLKQQHAEWGPTPRDLRQRLARILTDIVPQSGAVRPSVIFRQRAERRNRAPLFDRRFNEFCLSLPFDQQIRDGWDRRLLRESMRGVLPENIRCRVTRGFPQPDFQRHFQFLAPDLRLELNRIKSSPIVREYLDCEWLSNRLSSTDQATNTWTAESQLINGITLGRYLEWYDNWK